MFDKFVRPVRCQITRRTLENTIKLNYQSVHCFSTTSNLSDEEVKKCIEELGDKFSEARELLTDAVKSN